MLKSEKESDKNDYFGKWKLSLTSSIILNFTVHQNI